MGVIGGKRGDPTAASHEKVTPLIKSVGYR
jgi:hypothetical protein